MCSETKNHIENIADVMSRMTTLAVLTARMRNTQSGTSGWRLRRWTTTNAVSSTTAPATLPSTRAEVHGEDSSDTTP